MTVVGTYLGDFFLRTSHCVVLLCSDTQSSSNAAVHCKYMASLHVANIISVTTKHCAVFDSSLTVYFLAFV
jgi:hypothetical protein